MEADSSSSKSEPPAKVEPALEAKGLDLWQSEAVTGHKSEVMGTHYIMLALGSPPKRPKNHHIFFECTL